MTQLQLTKIASEWKKVTKNELWLLGRFGNSSTSRQRDGMVSARRVDMHNTA